MVIYHSIRNTSRFITGLVIIPERVNSQLRHFGITSHHQTVTFHSNHLSQRENTAQTSGIYRYFQRLTSIQIFQNKIFVNIRSSIRRNNAPLYINILRTFDRIQCKEILISLSFFPINGKFLTFIFDRQFKTPVNIFRSDNRIFHIALIHRIISVFYTSCRFIYRSMIT